MSVTMRVRSMPRPLPPDATQQSQSWRIHSASGISFIFYSFHFIMNRSHYSNFSTVLQCRSHQKSEGQKEDFELVNMVFAVDPIDNWIIIVVS